MEPLAAHQRAQEVFAGVLAGVEPGQLDDPTPCTEWAVRELIDHVIAGNNGVAGERSSGSGDDLVAAHAASAERAQAAFAAPDGMDRGFDLPFGTVPGRVFVGMRTTEVLTHAWDLARATGQPTDLDPELAVAMLEQARQGVQPEFRGPGRPFGQEQDCPPDRSAEDQLAACLGRPVD